MGKGVALMARSKKPVLAALALMLAACGSDPSEAPLATVLLSAAKTAVSPKAQPAAAMAITRAQIAATGGIPLIRLGVPSRDVVVYITRRDTNSGTESWATGDNTVVTLRNGVLISTRGLTPDLMSAAAPTVSQLANSGGSHARSYFVLGDNDTNDRLEFTCKMASLGSQRLEVIERVYATTHMQETCTGDAGKIVNDFWIEGGGFIRQSHQWTNPKIGYIDIAKLVE